jgi:hypothetical protein
MRPRLQQAAPLLRSHVMCARNNKVAATQQAAPYRLSCLPLSDVLPEVPAHRWCVTFLRAVTVSSSRCFSRRCRRVREATSPLSYQRSFLALSTGNLVGGASRRQGQPAEVRGRAKEGGSGHEL